MLSAVKSKLAECLPHWVARVKGVGEKGSVTNAVSLSNHEATFKSPFPAVAALACPTRALSLSLQGSCPV